jgi:hypothetical protein
MNSCALIIPTCRHVLPGGRRCQQPAVRRRSCCRHHLDAQARLRNCARARRRSLILRLRAVDTPRDLDWNKAEVNRVLATERLDPNVARMMLWAMDLATTALHAKSACRPRPVQNRASNPNEIYDVAINPLFPQRSSKTLSQVTENTRSHREGGTPIQLALSTSSLPAAPSSLNRAERRRLAAISNRETRNSKSDRRQAKRERRTPKSDER